jgi:hypothetical protein
MVGGEVMADHSGYFIDERGIHTVESSSYPDAVWHEYAVEFGKPDSAAKFEEFCQRLLREGGAARAAEVANLLGIRLGR